MKNRFIGPLVTYFANGYFHTSGNSNVLDFVHNMRLPELTDGYPLKKILNVDPATDPNLNGSESWLERRMRDVLVHLKNADKMDDIPLNPEQSKKICREISTNLLELIALVGRCIEKFGIFVDSRDQILLKDAEDIIQNLSLVIEETNQNLLVKATYSISNISATLKTLADQLDETSDILRKLVDPTD